MDAWLASPKATHRDGAGNFVRWAHRQKLTRLDFAAVKWGGPTGVIDTETRWEQARWLLHDDTVKPEDRVAGVLTIRDILIRLVAAGLHPTATPVSQVMSSSLFTCTEEDTAEEVAERMAEHRIEQMPVLDAGGRLVGLITRHAAETLLARNSHSGVDFSRAGRNGGAST